MKKFYFIFIVVSLVLGSCSAEKKVSRSSFLLDTFCSVTIYGTTNPELADKSLEIVSKYDKQLNPFDPQSDIAKLNMEKTHDLDWDIIQLLRTALFVGQKTNGKLDITMGELRDLWPIKDENPKIPDTKAIAAVLEKTGNQQIYIDGKTVTIGQGQIDLGAVAKGFIADKIVLFLKESDVQRAIINLGGNIYTLNSPQSPPWKVGIKSPIINEGKSICIVQTMSESVVTSGKYERYFEHEGVTYHHIFDPTTGRPVENNLLSASVVHKDSTLADAFSTALLCVGLEHAIEVAKANSIDAIFITEDMKIYVAKSLESRFTITDTRFTLELY